MSVEVFRQPKELPSLVGQQGEVPFVKIEPYGDDDPSHWNAYRFRGVRSWDGGEFQVRVQAVSALDSDARAREGTVIDCAAYSLPVFGTEAEAASRSVRTVLQIEDMSFPPGPEDMDRYAGLLHCAAQGVLQMYETINQDK